MTLDELAEQITAFHEIVETLTGEPTKRVGREWVTRCPFHEDRNPSLSINDTKRVYHCWGCGASGGFVTFVRELRGCSFKEAVSELARLVGCGDVALARPSLEAQKRRAVAERLRREVEHQRLAKLWPLSDALRRNRRAQSRLLAQDLRAREYVERVKPLMEKRRTLLDQMEELTGNRDHPELY